MKKIIAILLVVALMSAMFVVPAHAHEADEVNPRAMLCDDLGGCRQAMMYHETEVSRSTELVPTCNNCYGGHYHTSIVYRRYYTCVTSYCRYYDLPVDAYTYTYVRCDG